MAIVLSRQYQHLVAVAESANQFVFYNGEEYEGIVRPAGIIRITNKNSGEHFLFFVVAEDVPHPDPREPSQLIAARLDDTYEFESYDAESKTLDVSNENLVSDRGTIDQLCLDLREGGGYMFTCKREWPA